MLYQTDECCETHIQWSDTPFADISPALKTKRPLQKNARAYWASLAAPCLKRELLRFSYISLICTHLEYASAVLAPYAKSQLDRLDVIEKICIEYNYGATERRACCSDSRIIVTPLFGFPKKRPRDRPGREGTTWAHPPGLLCTRESAVRFLNAAVLAAVPKVHCWPFDLFHAYFIEIARNQNHIL